MEEFKLPTGEEIPVYRPFSLYDAIEHFMAPLHDFRTLLNTGIEEMPPAAVLNVLEALLRDERRLIRAHLTDIEEKLGGSVKVTCAAYNQDVIQHGTILEARIVPRGRTKDVPGSDTSKPDEIPDFRTAAPGSEEAAQLQRVFTAMRDDASLLKVEAILTVAELLEILEDNPKGRALVEKLERLLEAKEVAGGKGDRK